jgi:hypothetical protein
MVGLARPRTEAARGAEPKVSTKRGENGFAIEACKDL